jgi:serine/threonine protein kinase
LQQCQTTPTSSKKKQVSPLSLLREDSWNVTTSPHQGRSSQAFLLDRDSTAGENEELFVKKVLIMSPENMNDKAYREQRILRALKELDDRDQCFNFVTMLLSGISENEYLEMVLERGGATLHQRRQLTVAQLRDLLFQLLYALDVAQRELRFVHYDLHDKNLMIEDLKKGTALAIQLHDGRLFHCRSLLLKIADFALSRIDVGNETVYNTKNAMRGAFDPSHDLSNFVDCLARIDITDRAEQIDAMKELKLLRHKMKTGTASPGTLLSLPFFSPLLEKLAPGECVVRRAVDRAPRQTTTTSGILETRQSPRKKK